MSAQPATAEPSSVASIFHYIAEKGSTIVAEAQNPGTVQRTTQAAIRSLVGITAIANFPYTAGLGATVSVVKPGLVRTSCSMLEGAISGIWGRMSFNQKAAVATAGVASALYFDPSMVFTTLGTVFAFKLGAELGLKNLRKEEMIHAQIEAARELEEAQ